MSVTNPVVPNYASRVPYITPAEYIAAPTGVDISALTLNGTTGQNSDQLVQVIARASSVIDVFCRKVLAATVDTQAGMYRLRNGVLRVALDNTPILQVQSVSVGIQPSSLAPLSDLSNLWIGKKTIQVPVYPSQLSSPASVSPSPFGADWVYAVTTYVNGFANTILTADAAVGATSITVQSSVGIFAGLTLTIYDAGQSEQITVQSVAGNVLTLTSALTATQIHAKGVAVSALPPAIKEAAILITSGLIKTRADESFVMPELGGQQSSVAAVAGHAGTDFDLAEGLLIPFGRVA